MLLPALPSAASFPLTAHDLTCVRGDHRVFSSVSFSLKSGQALHVTGQNGAGKTSLLRLLAGLIAPEHGITHWQDGETVAQVPERALYIGHLDGLKPSLTAQENLNFWASFLGQGSVQPLPSDPFVVTPLLSRAVRVLSAGQKRRVSLSRLVPSSAWLWLLDEPTTALDARSQTILWQLVQAHCARGGAVVVSSHGACPLAHAMTLDLSVPSAMAEAT